MSACPCTAMPPKAGFCFRLQHNVNHIGRQSQWNPWTLVRPWLVPIKPRKTSATTTGYAAVRVQGTKLVAENVGCCSGRRRSVGAVTPQGIAFYMGPVPLAPCTVCEGQCAKPPLKERAYRRDSPAPTQTRRAKPLGFVGPLPNPRGASAISGHPGKAHIGGRPSQSWTLQTQAPTPALARPRCHLRRSASERSGRKWLRRWCIPKS